MALRDVSEEDRVCWTNLMITPKTPEENRSYLDYLTATASSKSKEAEC